MVEQAKYQNSSSTPLSPQNPNESMGVTVPQENIFDRTLSRRQFMAASLAVGAGLLLEACGEDKIVVEPTPSPKPTPDLSPVLGTSEYSNKIPNFSTTTVNVNFKDVTDFYGDPDIDLGNTYYMKDENKYYSGFASYNNEGEILGWGNIEIESRFIETNTPGMFAYEISGNDLEDLENNVRRRQRAVVFVDIHNSKETIIRNDFYDSSSEFDISSDGNILAINLRLISDEEIEGAYLLNTKNWELENRVGGFIRHMQISEDGKLIYSQGGNGSDIIDPTTGDREPIKWPLWHERDSFAPRRGTNKENFGWDILSPNFEYIAAPIYLFVSGGGYLDDYQEYSHTAIKTPSGWYSIEKRVERLSNDGTVFYKDGTSTKFE